VLLRTLVSRAAGAAAAVALTLTLAPTAVPAAAPASTAPRLALASVVSATSLKGQDVSWPQCPKGMGRGKGEPIPENTPYVSGTTTTVIGVNQGKPFYANPCLKTLVAWAKAHHQYVAAYTLPAPPTSAELSRWGTAGPYRGTDTVTRMRNNGYVQATWTVANIHAQGFAPTFIWLDVEPLVLRTWGTTTAAKRNNWAVIQGMQLGFARAGIRTGFYSTNRFWTQIVGSARTTSPMWAAYSVSSRSAALSRCSYPQASGGPVAMVQFYHFAPLVDQDVSCARMTSLGGVGAFFIKY